VTTKPEPGIFAPFPNTAFDVVALVASAGGLKALTEVLGPLPADFPAALVVVQHMAPLLPSHLAAILTRRTCLAVQYAVDGACLRPGHVYLAVPDKHLRIREDGTLSFTDTVRVHFVRPSADQLFESMASSCRGRGIGVVLTGTGSDGATGVLAIKHHGGVVIAQDEPTSEFFGMPGAAIATGGVDFVLPLAQIEPCLVSLMKKGGTP